MLLTLTTTAAPATDLGYLLHKHPARVQSFERPVGTAYVFYPEATDERCTAALLLEVDPVGLVRGRRGQRDGGFALGQYVNDRPYAASSLLAAALKDVFRTALTGQCQSRPELAATPIPLTLHLPVLPCRGGATLAERVFGPLGWTVDARPIPLDETVPAWGDSPYVDLTLSGTVRLADALNHLYVLLPVLDDAKHYWVAAAEVDKLVRAGGGWLAGHPEKALITARYLAHRRELTADALARLAEVDDTDPETIDNAVTTADRPLNQQRRDAVLAALRAIGARRVGDLGCGDGALTRDLLAEPGIESIVATDVSARALGHAARRLDRLPDAQRAKIELFQSSLSYRDDRLSGLDVAVLMEVIEHVDPSRLRTVERTVFGHAAPKSVIVTTPNSEYNVRFPGLSSGSMRHPDHRFEWTRPEFRQWAARVAGEYDYEVEFRPVGPEDADVGSPTQLAVFRR